MCCISESLNKRFCKSYLNSHSEDLKVVTGVRITGDFYTGPHHLKVDNKTLSVGPFTLGGNLSVRTGGLKLTSTGFSM
jgi:hypothetical protein